MEKELKHDEEAPSWRKKVSETTIHVFKGPTGLQKRKKVENYDQGR